MFVFKKNYYLIIESIKDIDLSNIKISNKFNIIYRNLKQLDEINDLLRFRKICKSKRINFYISNDTKLASIMKADGLYISAYNDDLRLSRLKNSKYMMIGSAHNNREINIKILQGCSEIIFSRLFETSYSHKKGYLGIVKFNILQSSIHKNLVPLGGINLTNLNKLNLVNCQSFTVKSEVKKKPAILSRLF